MPLTELNKGSLSFLFFVIQLNRCFDSVQYKSFNPNLYPNVNYYISSSFGRLPFHGEVQNLALNLFIR